MNPGEVRRRWARREGEFSPDYYAHKGANETSDLVRDHLDASVGAEASVLELGCSAGRHLAHLREGGYRDLHGVDLNADAFDVMAEAYPDLAASGTFRAAAIEEFLPDVAEDRFDAVVSVETLQHVHPDDAWVFDEVARVAGDRLVVVENEGRDREADVTHVRDEVPLYHRDWAATFEERGFAQVAAAELKYDTFRAFAPAN